MMHYEITMYKKNGTYIVVHIETPHYKYMHVCVCLITHIHSLFIYKDSFIIEIYCVELTVNLRQEQ